jgi:SAM-dependent methyltransferase
LTDPSKQIFDSYQDSYVGVVKDSVAFSGLSYDYFLRSKAAMLRSLLEEWKPGLESLSLLDVGCGIGTLHPLLRPMFGAVHGVDVSRECIERARLANPWASYEVYDGSSLPIEDGAFDVVLAVCVAHHVKPADWESFFKQLKRATRPGGLICVIEHNPVNPLTRLSVMRCEFDKDAVLLPPSLTARLLRSAGVEQVAVRYFVFVPSTAPWALGIERRLAKLPLGAQYAAFGRA